MRRAAKKPINMAKVAEVVQTADESPGAFLERLKEAYRRHTPIDPDDGAQEMIVKAAFVAQAAPDIRRKIQKQEGFLGHRLEWMLTLAQSTYNQREEEAQKQKEKYQIKKLMALRASQQPEGQKHNPGTSECARGRGRARLGRNQCAICKQEGHWKMECPQRQGPHTPLAGNSNQGPMPRAQPWASALQPQARPWTPGNQGRGRGQGPAWTPPHQPGAYGAMALRGEEETYY